MHGFMVIFILKIGGCNSILPQYLPANQEGELTRNEAIINYFRLGFTAQKFWLSLLPFTEFNLAYSNSEEYCETMVVKEE